MFTRLLFVLLVVAFSYDDARAFGSCLEALEPECAANEDTYKSKEAYEACTSQLQSMSEKTKEYIDCMKKELKETADEVQSKADAITDKVNELMKKFNCRADPKASC